MFTEVERAGLLERLIARGRSDPAVTALAVVGSTARRATDRWSDLDLAFRLAGGVEPSVAADAWLAYLTEAYAVADHLDLWSGPALYRVFLLANSLQVDLSFWPAGEFASTSEPFELIFGAVDQARPAAAVDRRAEIGWAWLHALHARSALARNRHWQALLMIDGTRDRVITLACVRHGLPSHHGRGVDDLPESVRGDLEATLPSSSAPDHLAAAFARLTALLQLEIALVDADLARRLAPVLQILAGPPSVEEPPGREQPSGP